MSVVMNAGDRNPFFLEAGAWFTASGACEVLVDRGPTKIRQKIGATEQQVGPFLSDAQILIIATAETTYLGYPAEAWIPTSVLGGVRGGSRVGLDDSADAETFTDVQEFADTRIRVANYTAFDASTAAATVIEVTGYLVTAGPSGIAGQFVYVPGAVWSANGGARRVRADGRHYERVIDGSMNVQWFETVGDGATVDVPAIQAAIDAAEAMGVDDVFFPPAEYGLGTTPIVPRTGVSLTGAGQGSALKIVTASATSCIRRDTVFEDVCISKLAFIGSIGYPVSSEIDPVTLTTQNGVFFGDCSNVEVRNCYFTELASAAVTFIALAAMSGIVIADNYFYKGSYKYRPIQVITAGVSPYDVQITDNRIYGAGPEFYFDASNDAYTSSNDGIDVDGCDTVVITGNIIRNVAGYGIRVEESFRVTVANNPIWEPGAGGITFYNNSRDCTCSNNPIYGWGRIPPANTIREYSGTYYIAKELIGTSPADPSIDSRYIVWPYTLTGVDVSTIRPYVAGVLQYPFRGYAAISVTQQSSGVTVSENPCEGNLDTSGGKYTHASDFGYTPVHPVNAGSDNNGINCSVKDNRFKNTRLYDVYQPRYMNPTAGNGQNGGKVAFSLLEGTTCLIENVLPDSQNLHAFSAQHILFPVVQVPSSNPNVIDDYREPQIEVAFQCMTSGTVTIDGTYKYLECTKVGRKVTLTGQLRASAVSSPTGALRIVAAGGALPYPSVAASGDAVAYVRAQNMTGTAGQFQAYIPAGADYIVISKDISNVIYDGAASFTATTILIFTLTYNAAT